MLSIFSVGALCLGGGLPALVDDKLWLPRALSHCDGSGVRDVSVATVEHTREWQDSSEVDVKGHLDMAL
jgi:hypothetical protein